MPQPAGYQGWGALGKILGGGAGTPGAYEKQLGLAYDTQGKGYSRDKAMEEAAFARNINIARAGGLEEKLKGALGEEQGGLVAQILRGNRTMDLGQVEGYARPGYLRAGRTVEAGLLGEPPAQAVLGDAPAAAILGELEGIPGIAAPVQIGTGAPVETLGAPAALPVQAPAEVLGEVPDIAAANRALALMKGQDYQPIRELGGALMADGVGLDELDMIPTLTTLDRMQRTGAAIEQGDRRTDASVAKSNRAPTSRSGGGRSANPETAELERARNAVQNGADPGQVADLLRKRGFPALAKKIYSPGTGR